MGVFSLTGWSRLIRAGFLVSRLTQDTAGSSRASRTGLSPSMVKLSRLFRSRLRYRNAVLLPRPCRNRTGLGSSPVARHYWGNHCLFSLPRGTKMFQFPRFASMLMRGRQSFRLPGCPIRKSADQRSFAPTRGLSQLITSFIASMSLGIRHTPFLTFFALYHSVSS